MTTSELLDALWRDYVASTPQAERIHHLLAARGEIIRNDHVALRTFDAPGIGIEALARAFEALGWQPRDRYRFDDKHLRRALLAARRPGAAEGVHQRARASPSCRPPRRP